MSILKIIEEVLEGNALTYEDIDATKIIRIEKELKAKHRLGEDISVNDIEMMVQLLSTNAREMSVLQRPYFYQLQQIIRHPTALIVFKSKDGAADLVNEKFKGFIKDQFLSELQIYVNECLKNDHYNALHSLLYYVDILPLDLIDDILNSLTQKLNYGNEVLVSGSSNYQHKVLNLLNPFFYRCCNVIGPIYFESVMVSIYNAGVSKEAKGFQYRFIHAVSFFKSTDMSMAELLQENNKIAQSGGARERKEKLFDNRFKGGTYISDMLKFRTEPSDGAGFVKAFFAVIFFLGLIILGANKLTQNSYNFQTDSTIPMPIRRTLLESFGPKPEDLLYGQYASDDSLIFQDCDFKIENTQFKNGIFKSSGFSSVPDIELINKTNKDIIVIWLGNDGVQHDFLTANGSILKIQPINKVIRIYPGNKPQYALKMPDALSFDEKSQRIFRFGEFTQKDSAIAHEVFELIQILSLDGKYQVTEGEETYFIKGAL